MPDRDRRIRAVPDETWRQLRTQAVARGLTLAQWITKLVQAQENVFQSSPVARDG